MKVEKIRGNNLTQGQKHENQFQDCISLHKFKDPRAESFAISILGQISLANAPP